MTRTSCSARRNPGNTYLMWELACVGAGLARDAGTSVIQLDRGDAIAGKPAPTQASSHIGFRVFEV
ncbi:hypothetical protein FIV37_09395 [Pseudomonas gessardii]|nr:hypothetical protein [Pseudomonas gessardii]